MEEAPTTRASLLVRLRDGQDADAWGEFVKLYAPVGSAEWDQEYERQLAALAMDRVRGEFHEATWEAFRRTAVEGQSPKAVAAALHLSPGAVYVAKSRVLARLREEVQRLQED